MPEAPREREIKLAVPTAAWDRLLSAFCDAGASELRLHAAYVDTPSLALARAGMSLRMRSEAGRWVQTLKAPGANAFERLEDTVDAGPATDDTPPPVDENRHQREGPAKALRKALAAEGAVASLAPVFEVVVTRRVQQLREGASSIEAALDEGELRAAGGRRGIRELELELVDGDPLDLVALARRWRADWGLWLDTTSKAQRGHLLAAGEPFAPPLGAQAPRHARGKRDLRMLSAAVLDTCVAQIVGNACELAAGSPSDEHVHQLRVGLRRLRTALRELPPLAGESRRFEPVLTRVFRALGERRDRTHVLQRIEPLVQAAGGSPVRVPPAFHEGADPQVLACDGEFQDCLLALHALALALPLRAGEPVRRTLRPRLSRLRRQVLRDGRRFTRLSEEGQHRVRKRLKRLRYLSEFLVDVFARKAVERYLSALKPAQDALGDYNDEVMAEALYGELAGTDPGANFGLQWLRGRRAERAMACQHTLRKLRSAEPFWKPR